MFTLLIRFARTSESSPGPVGGQLPPFAPRGDANATKCAKSQTRVNEYDRTRAFEKEDLQTLP